MDDEDYLFEDFSEFFFFQEDIDPGEFRLVKAFHCQKNKSVAIKIFPKQLLDESKNLQIKQETKNLMSLKHPNIVPLLEIFETE